MIDLHCHLLPGIDDGSPDLGESLSMARLAAQDGVRVIACTPHIMPGVYDNQGRDIRAAVLSLQKTLTEEQIPLRLVSGADVHIAPDLAGQIASGRVLTVSNSRYLLLEPPHHVLPPRFDQLVFDLLADGYVPIVTHPERLTWIEQHYPLMEKLVRGGAWLQITAGSLTGGFGGRPKFWADRLLADGLVHLLASDAHDSQKRTPVLSRARKLVAERLGPEEATHLVVTRPQIVLRDADPSTAPKPQATTPQTSKAEPFWRRALRATSKGGVV